MGTLSKTLASTGGYIAGSQALVDILRAGAPGFVYSVGLPPALAAAATSALEILEREPDRLLRLRAHASLFLRSAKQRGLETGQAINGSVIPVLIGDSINAVVISNRLFEKGFNALPIIFPAVAHKQARLRFFVTSEHTPEQIEAVVDATAEALNDLGSTMAAGRVAL
jgi:7-keto-8-aminopelargonate synthetase-like enzyme